MFKKHFDSYVIEGDSITCELAGFTFKAKLVQDSDVRPEEFDCYTPKQIQAWKDDKWHYFGIVLSASYNGIDCGIIWLVCGVLKATSHQDAKTLISTF